MAKFPLLTNKLLLFLVFSILISISNAGVCGNKIQSNDEQCDDGNLVSGDGCSNTCTLQRLFKCTTPNKLSVCSKSCVNGILDKIAGEFCDDGDSNATNGCTNDCTVVAGWKCSNVDGQKSTCSEICGDGIFVEKQKLTQNCDDGNILNEDGCSSTCTVETGYECQVGRTPYCQKLYRCGNGKYQPTNGELCDDGDLNDQNGCNTTCQITNSSFACQNTLQQKSICYFDCRIPVKTTIINEETVSNHQNLAEPQTCFLNLQGEQVCFKDCLDIYYHKTVISSGVYLNSYYNDKLYFNDHNLISGDGCSNCQLDEGVNSTKLSLLEEKNQTFVIEYGRISYIHNCGNQVVDENQDNDIPLYPQTKKNCSIFCPFTKSVCGNLILENEEECDSLVGCNEDCSGPLNENYSCDYHFSKSVNNKFVTVIAVSICYDIRIKTPAEELIKYYLKFSKQEYLGFYNFSVAQIKQIFVQNSADFSYFQTHPQLYTPPRLLYYLTSQLISNGAVQIRYNGDIQNMKNFIQNVITKTLTEQSNPIIVTTYGESWEIA